MNESQIEQWNKAQKGEAAWWTARIKGVLKPKNRDWYLGYVKNNFLREAEKFKLGKGLSINMSLLQPLILDLGSGIVSMLENENQAVDAIDPMLGRLKDELPGLVRIGEHYNVNYIDARINDAPSDRYNTVWCVNMLDHTPDWKEILTYEIPRVLKKNGRLFLSVDVRNSAKTLNKLHVGQFTAVELLDLLENKMHFRTEMHSTLGVSDMYRWYWRGTL